MANSPISFDQAMATAMRHHGKGELDQAANIYVQVLKVDPNNVGALHNLGELFCRRKRYDLAYDLVRRSLELSPNNPNNLNTMSVILMALGRADEAFAVCQRAVELNPNLSNAYSNLGICHADRGDTDKSLASFRKAIELDPNNACAHDGLGLTLLMTGQLQEGWREQEWRWRKYDFPPGRYPKAPHWHGEEIAGKRLMVYVEQGYGDLFQFCRYIPTLVRRGATVLMELVPELSNLLRRSITDATFFPPNDPPPFDMACPLMSVPLWCGTDLATIPADVPYLKTDPQRVEQWRQYFEPDRSFKVGIAWAGRPTHANDINRSAQLAAFAPLARVPGVTLYSLQKGPATGQLSQLPAGMKLINLQERLNDFDETAAAVSHLDLVISVDTALVHLAGALNRPVWNILAFCPDWRWMLGRTDTPWYPSMRLFRLPRRGAWAPAMEQVRAALQERVASFSPPVENAPPSAATN